MAFFDGKFLALVELVSRSNLETSKNNQELNTTDFLIYTTIPHYLIQIIFSLNPHTSSDASPVSVSYIDHDIYPAFCPVLQNPVAICRN